MGTRAIFTFTDQHESCHVFQHWDGYPSGAHDTLRTWIDSGLSWPFPRFEVDESAAGFIAANKTEPGGYRIAKSRTQYCDVEYGYTIKANNSGDITLVVSATDFWDGKRKESKLWSGPLADYTKDLARQIEG